MSKISEKAVSRTTKRTAERVTRSAYKVQIVELDGADYAWRHVHASHAQEAMTVALALVEMTGSCHGRVRVKVYEGHEPLSGALGDAPALDTELPALHLVYSADGKGHLLRGESGVTPRAPRAGYAEHDHVTEWQECDTCALRLGAGITTSYDTAYYAGDPDRCPRPGCDGRMCLPAEGR